ncbi:MAG TPA: HAD-IA family hydrolase [Xanthobacteraceae bacterium]|jgi:phosphoglycolate phosphatase
MPKLPALEAIVFDLDGTLVDSAEDLCACLNMALNAHGLRSIATGEIRSMIGDGVPTMVERALAAVGGDPGQSDPITARFREIYDANPVVATRCYSQVISTLEILRGRFRLAVATNKPIVATKKIVDRLFPDNLFSVVVGGDSLPTRKPDRGPLLDVLRQFAVGPDQAVMVGDNIHDVEAARAAGMRCIVVSYGYHHRPPSELHAEFVIDRFDELLPLVLDQTPGSAGELKSTPGTCPLSTGA